jgi:hypothetical protein
MMNRPGITMALLALASIASPLAGGTAKRYDPTDAERARWTYHDMRSIAIAFESYEQDHGQYPEATRLEDLREPLARYIRALPTHDAWGTPFRLTCNHGEGFQVVSAGSDRRFEETTSAASGEQPSFASDAVLEAGFRFVRSWALR